MSKLKKNFGYQIAFRILTIITPLITSPIITRALGAEKLGVYSATQAYVNYFVFAAMLGIENYGQRMIAAAAEKCERQRLFWEIYSIQLVSSLSALALYFVTLMFARQDRVLIMVIQSLWIVACVLSINWFFFGIEDFRVTVIRNFAIKIVTVLCIVLFIRKPEDLTLYVLVMAGGTAASELILWFSLRRRISFERVEWQRVRVHIIPILRLFIPVIAISLYHIMDKTMLDMLSVETEVGYYYAVDKIVYIPLGVIMAISTVMLTRMSYVLNNESQEKAKQLLEKSVELVLFITSAVTFGIAAISKEFIPMFFGPGYEPCVVLMYWILPVLLIKAMSDLVRTQYLIPAKKDNLFTKAVFCGAGTNIIVNGLLIPSLGAKGAVIGTLVAETVVLIVQSAGCYKEVAFPQMFLKQTPYIISGIIMLLCVRLFADDVRVSSVLLKLLLMVFIGAISYLVICGLLWLVRKNDSIFPAYLNELLAKKKKA